MRYIYVSVSAQSACIYQIICSFFSRYSPLLASTHCTAMAPSYKVTYFAYKGYCEPLRYMLTYAGIEFEDVRIPNDEWLKFKANTPFGKMPIVEIDGKKYNQAMAHVRYLAKENGLAGKDNWEALLIDMAADTVIDIRNVIGDYGWGILSTEKPKRKEEILKEILPFYYSRLDKQIAENDGYLVKGKLSYADIVLTASVEFISGVMEVDSLDGYNNLKALVEKVTSLPQIQEWIKKRPTTSF